MKASSRDGHGRFLVMYELMFMLTVWAANFNSLVGGGRFGRYSPRRVLKWGHGLRSSAGSRRPYPSGCLRVGRRAWRWSTSHSPRRVAPSVGLRA